MSKDRTNVTEKMSRFCDTVGCLRASADVLQFIDSTTEPCDDFYDFACGKLSSDSIRSPDGDEFFARWSDINDKINTQLHRLLDSPVEPNESKYERIFPSFEFAINNFF